MQRVLSIVVDDVHQWIRKPFAPDADWLRLFLGVGLVIVFIGLWVQILGHLQSRLE